MDESKSACQGSALGFILNFNHTNRTLANTWLLPEKLAMRHCMQAKGKGD